MPNKPENNKYRLYLCAFEFYHAGIVIQDEKNKTEEKQAKTNTGMKKCRKAESNDVSISKKKSIPSPRKSSRIKPDKKTKSKSPLNLQKSKPKIP